MSGVRLGNRPYLDHLPERLVVEGYRHWVAGYDTGMIDSWELATSLYERELGQREAKRLIGELSCWVRQIRRCSDCPLARFPYGSGSMCREECLAAAMVAAAQHGDRLTRDVCILGFGICPLSSGVAESTASFATSLDNAGLRLAPVPGTVIDTIAGRPDAGWFC